MNNYLKMLSDIYENGYDTLNDRTGVGTRSIFGYQLRFNLQDGFPLVTTKKVHIKSIIHELLWMLKGNTNIKYLVDNNVKIWNEWPHRYYVQQTRDNIDVKEFAKRIKRDSKFASKWGELGPVYGYEWRSWPINSSNISFKSCNIHGDTFDQIENVLHTIKNNPTCRRLIVSAWNAPLIKEMGIRGLPPCHCFFQFNIRENKYIDCQMYIRSWDTVLGGPFNIAQYAFMTHIFSKLTKYEVGDLIISSGNTHIYMNHFDGIKEQLKRTPKKLPTFKFKEKKYNNIDDFVFDDFIIEDYEYHPSIKFQIAI